MSHESHAMTHVGTTDTDHHEETGRFPEERA